MASADSFASADIPVGRAINAHIAGLREDKSRSSSTARQTIAAFSKQLNDCLNLLRSLIEEMMEASKLSDTAKHYFYPIIRRIDDDLVRLEIWASDIGFEDPDFGRSSREKDATLTLTRHMTDLLENIFAWLTEIGEGVDATRALIMQLSGSRFNDFKLNRKLDKILKHIESEHELVAFAVRNLVKLTEAFRLEQANELGIGPSAELQNQILHARERLSRGDKPHIAEPSRTTSQDVIAADDENLGPNFQSIETGKRGPWARSNILTFDGGGPAVLSSLLILEELMTEISMIERESLPVATSSASPLSLQPSSLRRQASEIPQSRGTLSASYLPCHYFDYIGGTSFGGIVAIMLGRLRMSVNECLEAVTHLVDSIWSKTRTINIRSLHWLSREEYSSRILPQQLEHMVSKASRSRTYNEIFRQPNQDMCRTAVTAYQTSSHRDTEGIILFCSYDQPVTESTKLDKVSKQTRTLTGTWRIAQIGVAATASPTFFMPAKIRHNDGTENYYLDASFGARDPTPEILTLATPAGEPIHEAVSTIVSIGMYDRTYARRARGGSYELTKKSMRWTRHNMWWTKKRGGIRERLANESQATSLEYVRLGIEGHRDTEFYSWEYKVDADSVARNVRTRTSEYLNSADVRDEIRSTAKRLVDLRRSRAKVDPDRWEIFCHGVEYACPLVHCPEIGKIFKERRGLRSHLEKVHHLDPRTGDSWLDKGKRFPLYEPSE